MLSPTTIMIKPRSMWCVRHVAFVAEMRNAARVLVRNPEKQHPLENPRHWWKVMLRWTWKKQDWRMVTWPIHLRGRFSIRIIQTFGCLKRQQVYSLLKQLLVSMRQAVLYQVQALVFVMYILPSRLNLPKAVDRLFLSVWLMPGMSGSCALFNMADAMCCTITLHESTFSVT